MRNLVGSGDRIALLVSPFVVAGVIIQLANPSLTSVGGPPAWLSVLSVAVLVPGLAIWIWSVILDALSRSFGDAWRDYDRHVKLHWL